jgi:hypothetical protein
LEDLYGVYFAPRDAVYLVPVDAVAAHHGRLRIDPAKNNQRQGVRLAADYAIDRWNEQRLLAVSRSGNVAAANRG